MQRATRNARACNVQRLTGGQTVTWPRDPLDFPDLHPERLPDSSNPGLMDGQPFDGVVDLNMPPLPELHPEDFDLPALDDPMWFPVPSAALPPLIPRPGGLA